MASAQDSLTLAGEFPAATQEQWRSAVDKVLKGADFEKKLVGRSADGIAIQPLYPRAVPVTTAGAAAGQHWGVMARVDHPDATEANTLALADLEGGATGLVLVPAGGLAALGYGLAFETVADLDRALAGVELDLIRIRLEPAPAGRINALLFAALCKARGLAASTMDVDFGVDPLGLATQRGVLPASWDETGRRVGDLVGTLRAQGFKCPVLTADARPYHEAGASQAQELATVLATLVAYLRTLEAQGMTLDAARGALSAILTADGDQFLTLAKFRALRRLWARVEQACRLPPAPLTIHAETAFRMMTKRDPWVNMLRGTIAVFSAGIGGADTVTALPFTQALGLPDIFARRVARNSQHVLLEESHLWRVVDPAAGSGAFETLTDELCASAWALFQQIEAQGRHGRGARLRSRRRMVRDPARGAGQGHRNAAHGADRHQRVPEPRRGARQRARCAARDRQAAGLWQDCRAGADRGRHAGGSAGRRLARRCRARAGSQWHRREAAIAAAGRAL